MRLDPGTAPPESLREVPRAELPSLYRSRYRIKPDRRYLYAFAEVDRIASGRSKPATLFLSFANGRWALRLESEEIGTLPEIPSASAAERLLDIWTEGRLKKHAPRIVAGRHLDLPALETALTSTSVEQVFVAFQKLGALAAPSTLDPGLLKAATRGVVWIGAQTVDRLQLSDPLFGHALGLLATSRALEPGCLASERALLLRLLGYEAEAIAAARELPAEDPVSAFASFDGNRLQSMASSAGASPRARYLYLLDQMRSGDPERWWPAFRESPWSASVDMASLAAVVRLGDFKVGDAASRDLTTRAFLEVVEAKTGAPSAEAWRGDEPPSRALRADLAKNAEVLKTSPEAQSRQFEKALGENAARADGRLLDAETLRSFYRATFYSSIYETARFYFDQLSDNDSAAGFARELRDPAPGTAADLALFLQDRAAYRNGASRDQFLADFGRFRAIGVAPLRRMLSSITRAGAAGATDPESRRLLRSLVAVLDTRPENLAAMLGLVRDSLQDLRMREQFVQAVAAVMAVGSDARVRQAVLAGDDQSLRELASDRRQSMDSRMKALTALKERKIVDVREAQHYYEAWMREEPDNLAILWTCARELSAAGLLPQARAEVRAWIGRRPTRSRDLTWASALQIEAEILADKKQWTQAYEVIEPTLDTGRAPNLFDGAWFLEELGQLDHAMKLARAGRDRYPHDVTGYTILARLHWRRREHDEAAKTLAASPYLSYNNWTYDVSKAFATVFGPADPHAGRSAFEALQRQKVPPLYLIPLATTVGASGNHALAAALLETLSHVGGAEGPAAAMWAYDEVAASEGKEAAKAWLEKNIPAPHQFALGAFQFEKYDLIWEPIEASTRADKDDQIQLMRAATVLIDPQRFGEHRQGLIARFESRPRQDWALFGLYLLGRATDQELFAASIDVGTLGWLMGVRAASEGCYDEASEWFSISVDSEQAQVPPRAWSYQTLNRWMNTGKSLSGLAAEKAF